MGWVNETGDGVDTCQVCGRPMMFDSGSRGTGYPYCGTCGERGALSDSQRMARSQNDIVYASDTGCAQNHATAETVTRCARCDTAERAEFKDRFVVDGCPQCGCRTVRRSTR